MTLTLDTAAALATQPLQPAVGPEFSYAANLTGVARGLFGAARAEEAVRGHDLDIALTARRAVLDLLTDVQADLTGLARSVRPIAAADLEAHPVEAFSRALHKHPRPPGQLGPTDVLLATPETPAGQAWQQIERHAVLAHHAWTTGTRRPAEDHPDAVWAGLADIAEVTATFTHLEPVLARAAAQSDRRDVFGRLQDAVRAPLAVAAREVLRLAATGPLPPVGLDRQAGVEATLSHVPSVADVPNGQWRTARMLANAAGLRPERIGQLAVLQARSALLVARALPAANGLAQRPLIDLRRQLLEHARLLSRVAERPGALASVVPGDGRPVVQAMKVHQRLAADPAALVARLPLLTEFTRALAATTPAVADAAERELEGGTWLVPDHTKSLGLPVWRALEPGEPVPASVVSVRKAADHAEQVRRAAEALPDVVTRSAPAPRLGPVVHARAAVAGAGLSPLLNRLPAGATRPRTPSEPVHRHPRRP